MSELSIARRVESPTIFSRNKRTDAPLTLTHQSLGGPIFRTLQSERRVGPCMRRLEFQQMLGWWLVTWRERRDAGCPTLAWKEPTDADRQCRATECGNQR